MNIGEQNRHIENSDSIGTMNFVGVIKGLVMPVWVDRMDVDIS